MMGLWAHTYFQLSTTLPWAHHLYNSQTVIQAPHDHDRLKASELSCLCFSRHWVISSLEFVAEHVHGRHWMPCSGIVSPTQEVVGLDLHDRPGQPQVSLGLTPHIGDDGLLHQLPGHYEPDGKDRQEPCINIPVSTATRPFTLQVGTWACICTVWHRVTSAELCTTAATKYNSRLQSRAAACFQPVQGDHCHCQRIL
jgi:hypothetical protein